MKFSELKRALRKVGCYKHSEGSNHEIWYSPLTGKKFPVGRHDSEDVRTGMLASIRADSGLKK